MVPDLETAKQNLEEIASKAREIKDSLFPIEGRIRKTSVGLPKTIILSRVYEELLTIQRIAMLKSTRPDADMVAIMQGRALFPFAVALYMPLKQIDFPFDYNDFYRGSLGSLAQYPPSSLGIHSLDLLLHSQNPAPGEKNKLPLEFVLERPNSLIDEEVSEEKLRDLQYFYNLEVDKFFEDYIVLLKLIRDKLGWFSEFNLKGLEERKISLSLGNIPLKILADGRSKHFYLDEEKKIIDLMLNSDDWSKSLKSIQNLINDFRNPRLGHLRRYRVLSTDGCFTPVQLSSAPEREDIIGIDDNLRRLEALVRGYAKGKSTPNIVLLGPGGVGKTTSLRYVMKATEDVENVRYFLMDSLDNMRQLAELCDEYKPVGIIDDMRGEVNPRVYAYLKQQLEGLGDSLSDKVLVIISANPEIWNSLDASVQQRLGGVELTYQPNPESYDLLVKQFCKRFGLIYNQGIVEKVKKMVPRQVRDYVRALGSEEAGLADR